MMECQVLPVDSKELRRRTGWGGGAGWLCVGEEMRHVGPYLLLTEQRGRVGVGMAIQ